MFMKEGYQLPGEIQARRSPVFVESVEIHQHMSGSTLEVSQKQFMVVSFENGDNDGRKSPTVHVTKQQEVTSDQVLPSPVEQPITELQGLKPGSSNNVVEESPSQSPKVKRTSESPNVARRSFYQIPLINESNNADFDYLEFNDTSSPAGPVEVKFSPVSDFSNGSHFFDPQMVREGSFERSLDNILDKCSEKSFDLSQSADSWNSSNQDGSKTPDYQGAGKSSKAAEKKKNKWYNIMTSTYKSRSEDFRRTFKDIPKEERLIVEYSCALQKDILVQGRMYISQNWICFFARIFNWETLLQIPCKEITAITKEKTARVIPNAVQVTTDKERYFFTSFGARDKTYMMLFRIWQNALLEQPMSVKELWTWVHYNYGDDLGMTTEDEDHLTPQCLEFLTEKLKEEIPLDKETCSDSETATTTAENNHPVSTEDTDAFISDEVFNSSSCAPTNHLNIKSKLPALNSSFFISSDDSEGEYLCDGHDHLAKLYLDEVFSIHIDLVFEHLFTDSPFFRAFVASRKTFDLNLPAWEEEPDENGNKVRNITYTITLNNSIGPKTSPSTEKQTCYKMSRPGRIYHVDCECCNGGIPYSDAFYMVLRYCLTRVSASKCRVVVTGELKFRRHIIMMFKSMIEKSAVNGLTDYFRQLSVHLRHEAQKRELFITGHPISVTKKKLRRRRVRNHASITDSQAISHQPYLERPTPTPPSPSKAFHREDRLIELNTHSLVRIIIVALILLLLFNAMLFYKLWSLENYANSVLVGPPQDYADKNVRSPQTAEEWSLLLEQQKNLHQSEINRWSEVLSTSVSVLEQMKVSLVNLQKSLRTGSQS